MTLFTPCIFTVIQVFGILTCFDSIFQAFVSAYHFAFSIELYANFVFPRFFIQRYSLMPNGIIYTAFGIPIILTMICQTQIVTFVIQAIAVNMVYKFSRKQFTFKLFSENYTMQSFFFAPSVDIKKPMCVIVSLDIIRSPIKFCKFLVAIVNYCVDFIFILARFAKGNRNSHLQLSFAESKVDVSRALGLRAFSGVHSLAYSPIIAQEWGII